MRPPTPPTGRRGARWSRDGPCESVEQRPLREIFRVPLHRDHPRGVRVRRFRALDHAVIGPRHGLETWSEVADRLMMAAVHRRRAHAEGALEERSGRDAHRMLARLVAVRHGAGPLAIQILIQGAAERDVEDLNATTDRENRQAARARRRNERELGGVTHGIDIAQARMRRRPVAVRRDVFTTREHQPADRCEGGSGAVGGQHRWDCEGNKAGSFERAHVRRVQCDAIAAIDHAARRGHGNWLSLRHDVGVGAEPPNNGQRGLLTLAQSTRTPYRFRTVLPPMTVPIAGWPAGSSWSSSSTPMARCEVSSTTSKPYPRAGKVGPRYCIEILPSASRPTMRAPFPPLPAFCSITRAGSESGMPRGGSVSTMRAFCSCDVISDGPASIARPQVGEPLLPRLHAAAPSNIRRDDTDRFMGSQSNAN